MIVTCESCKSRYKLDDAKITGRGAKITCPRCKHVFVVYAKTPSDPSRGEAEAPTMPPPAGSARQAPRTAGGVAPGLASEAPREGEWDDEPTRIADQQQKNEPPAPNGYEARFERTDEVKKAAAAPAAAPAPAPAAAKGDVAEKAAGLDFRKVGVTTWKVKVKIGLIYDFSDIKTLRKYIQDGRVTPADVISWDGKTWKPIGEIPDLDAFFVEVYDRLAAQALAAPPAPPPDPKPTPTPPPEAKPSATPTPPKNEPTPNQFRDPFEELKQRQRERAQKKPAPAATAKKEEAAPKGRLSAPLGIGITVVCALIIAWQVWVNSGPKVDPALLPPTVTEKQQQAGSVDDLKKKLNQEIADSMKRAPEPSDTDASASDEKVTTPRYTPERPPPQQDRGAASQGTPVRQPGTTSTSPQPVAQKASASTAKDHESVGDDAARAADWSTAAKAYQNAVDLDPKNGGLQYKLGTARYNAGDKSGAEPAFRAAAGAGRREAWKYIGHILREQGDVPGANAAYQEYLKGNPTDRAEIEALINGG